MLQAMHPSLTWIRFQKYIYAKLLIWEKDVKIVDTKCIFSEKPFSIARVVFVYLAIMVYSIILKIGGCDGVYRLRSIDREITQYTNRETARTTRCRWFHNFRHGNRHDSINHSHNLPIYFYSSGTD